MEISGFDSTIIICNFLHAEGQVCSRRAVIKFLTKKGLNAIDIHKELVSVYGDDCCSRSIVESWTHEFQMGRESLEDDDHSGRPSTSTAKVS